MRLLVSAPSCHQKPSAFIFCPARTKRSATSATYREIMDAMWLFNEKFERARVKFDEIKAGKPS